MRGTCEKRAAGGQSGHEGAGRPLAPEDQVDEFVDHYPDSCRGCGREFADEEKVPSRRPGRRQVAELPPISGVRERASQPSLALPVLQAADGGRVPGRGRRVGVRAEAAGGGRDADRAQPDLAPRPVRARPRAVRDPLSVGAVDAICQRASIALAEPHQALVASVLRSPAVNVDETGWTTRRDRPDALDRDHPRGGDLPDRRRPPPRPAPRAPRRPLRRHLLLRPLVGLQPHRPRKPPSLLEPPPARLPLPRRRAPHPEALRRARPRAHQAASSQAWHGYQRTPRPRPARTRDRPDPRPSCAQLLEEAGRKTPKNKYHRGFANNLLKIWPALWTFVTHRRRRTDQQRRRTITPRTRHPPQTLPRHPQPTTANASSNAPSPPRSPAASRNDRSSPTSPTCSPPTPAATRSPPSPEPGD